ncbi:glycosyl transferase [Campylobacter sp. RM17709]|nr:glycosyl transferase [Campylobacter sp. RM17709]
MVAIATKEITLEDDEIFFKDRHQRIFNYIPNFKKPQTFNEKLVYRMLYDRSPFYTFLADKLKMRIFVNEILSNSCNNILSHNSILYKDIDKLKEEILSTNSCKYLPKLYAIYDNIYDIDFNTLPNSFVLKTNHDCGGYVIVEDKIKFLRNTELFSDSMQKLQSHLNTNYYYLSREWHYKDIKPKIFAEELLKDKNEKLADTYKFHIFDHEKIENNYIQVTTDRFNNYQRFIMNTNWSIAPFNFVYDIPQNTLPKKPSNFKEMLNISLKLSRLFDYVRVDLYSINDQIYIGELTFTHGAAGEKLNPEFWDKKLGELWNLRILSDATK